MRAKTSGHWNVVAWKRPAGGVMAAIGPMAIRP
jgi:hypothetical protein